VAIFRRERYLETLETVYKSSLYGIPALVVILVPIFILPMLFNYLFDFAVIAGALSMVPRPIQYMRSRADNEANFQDSTTLSHTITATVTSRTDAVTAHE
jgi:hypothetical protein